MEFLKTTKKSKIMEALFGEASLTTLSSEDITWAASNLPNTDELGNHVSEGIDFTGTTFEEKDSVLESLGLEKGSEVKLVRKMFPYTKPGSDLKAPSTYSQAMQELLPLLTKKDIIILALSLYQQKKENFDRLQQMLNLAKSLNLPIPEDSGYNLIWKD